MCILTILSEWERLALQNNNIDYSYIFLWAITTYILIKLT
jgi:hypothetical protein